MPHDEPAGQTRVLALVATLSMITYLDRACFGAAAPLMARELGLTGVADLKWAFTAFALAYAVFEIPCGWLGDAFGPRRALLRIVLWWSIFTALTGLVGLRVGGVALGGLTTLVVLRFLFGMGEAGAYPNITRAIHNWFGAAQRGRAQGVVWMSGRLMGGLTPLVWAILVAGTALSPPLVSWRGAFLLFGLVGLVWAAGFAVWFADHPRPSVDTALSLERPPSHHAAHTLPWRAFFTSGNLWMLCLMYFAMTYGWYFNITYLPAALRELYAVDDGSLLGALYKGGPLWVGAAGCLIGGQLTDRLGARWGDRRKARRRLASSAFTVGAAAFALCPWATSAPALFALLSLAAFCGDLTLAAAWATCQDIGQRYAATAAAWMNTIGTLGAATAGWAIGAMLEAALNDRAASLGTAVAALPVHERVAAYAQGYSLCFLTFAGAYFVAAICWQFVDPARAIKADDPQPQQT